MNSKLSLEENKSDYCPLKNLKDKTNKLYSKLSVEPIDFIKSKIFYITKDNEIKTIKNDVIQLSITNKIKKEDIFHHIVKNKNNHKYNYFV